MDLSVGKRRYTEKRNTLRYTEESVPLFYIPPVSLRTTERGDQGRRCTKEQQIMGGEIGGDKKNIYRIKVY